MVTHVKSTTGTRGCKHNAADPHLISQEAQLGEEVLSLLDLFPHCAFLHLRPHGLSLLTDDLLNS